MRKLALLPYILCLTLLAACVETDISVPGFPEMVRYFSATEAQVQMTMAINFLAFCIAGLFYGPLSDTFGRRKTMIYGNIIFLIGAIGTSMASSIETLIAWRFFQGLGASAGWTVAFAMVADAYQGERASKLVNLLNGILTAAMAGAPVLGSFLVESLGWRSTYSSVAVLCFISTVTMILFLPETHHNRIPFKPKQILSDFKKLLTSFDFMALTLVPTLQCTGYMAFVAGAVFFYVETMGVSLVQFAIYQACAIGSFSLISLLNGQITALLGTRRMLVSGLFLNVLGAVILLALALMSVKIAYLYTIAMCMYAVGVAFCYGPTFTASLELYPNLKGAASSLNMAIRLFVMSMAINAVSVLANHTFIPETALIFISAMSAGGCLIFIASQPKIRQILVQEASKAEGHAPL